MTTRQKQKRQEEARQTAQTPIADAIVIGTAAGGLVLGTMQSQAASETDDNSQPLQDRGAVDQVVPTIAAIEPPQAAVDGPQATPVEMAALPVEQTVSPIAAPGFDPIVASAPMPLTVQDQLVQELSQQMAGTIAKLVDGVEPGTSAAEVSQAISADIVQAAQKIVAGIDVGSLLTDVQGMVETTIERADPVAIVDQILGDTSALVGAVLTEVDALPAEILGNTAGALSELPSSLLGNEGPDGSGGVLSELFYADGASDSLAIPDLSSVAASLVTGADGIVGGLLGVSYVDMPDPQGGHGLNALSLL